MTRDRAAPPSPGCSLSRHDPWSRAAPPVRRADSAERRHNRAGHTIPWLQIAAPRRARQVPLREGTGGAGEAGTRAVPDAPGGPAHTRTCGPDSDLPFRAGSAGPGHDAAVEPGPRANTSRGLLPMQFRGSHVCSRPCPARQGPSPTAVTAFPELAREPFDHRIAPAAGRSPIHASAGTGERASGLVRAARALDRVPSD